MEEFQKQNKCRSCCWRFDGQNEVKNISIHDEPAHVIIHAGTNNLPSDTSEQCIKNIKGLCISVKQRFPNAKLDVSSIILRKDIDVSGITRQVNNQLKHICDESGYTILIVNCI